MRNWVGFLGLRSCVLNVSTIETLDALEDLLPPDRYCAGSNDANTILLVWMSQGRSVGLIQPVEYDAICRDIWGRGEGT
jgi:hypothetical protein